jgi:hypothetical protein
MFNPFKKKSKRVRESRATHFVGTVFSRYGGTVERCGTKQSGLRMRLDCPKSGLTVKISAEHIDGGDYVRIYKNVGLVTETVAVIDNVPPQKAQIPTSTTMGSIESSLGGITIYPAAPMKIVGGDDIGGRA